MVDYLIIARSGRALAASAKRAGYKVCVADCFADADTKDVSESVHRLQFTNNGFIEAELLTHVQKVISHHPNIKLITGSGFESSPGIIQSLNELAPVISNTKETIDAVKNPSRFFNMLNNQKICHPEFSFSKPDDTKKYVIKKKAGIGGEHVNWADQYEFEIGSTHYFQEYISGVPASALFLANGAQASIIGFNQQLISDEFADMPFLYQGAIRLEQDSVVNRNDVEHIVNVISKEAGLKGLCGLDYIVKPGNEIVVLEINPRPPSTFELYEFNQPLFNAHLACFEGKLPDCIGENEDKESFRAYAIYYAKEKMCINGKIEWPDWVKDRPVSGSIIEPEYPVCTVFAEDISLDKVKSMLFNRLLEIETMIAAKQD